MGNRKLLFILPAALLGLSLLFILFFTLGRGIFNSSTGDIGSNRDTPTRTQSSTSRVTPTPKRTYLSPSPSETRNVLPSVSKVPEDDSAAALYGSQDPSPRIIPSPDPVTPTPEIRQPGSSSLAVIPEAVTETIYFQPNDSTLLSRTNNQLRNIYELLSEYPGTRVKITGHCAPLGTEQGRILLSRERAENVLQYLRELGWDPEIPPEVSGKGGDVPATLDPEKQNLNRRVVISLLP